VDEWFMVVEGWVAADAEGVGPERLDVDLGEGGGRQRHEGGGDGGGERTAHAPAA
jgi:hypothetical protein